MKADRTEYYRMRYLHKLETLGRSPRCPASPQRRSLTSELRAFYRCQECGTERSYGFMGDKNYNPLIGCDKFCQGRTDYDFRIPNPTRHTFVILRWA